MQFKFKDILSEELYSTAKVVYVLGSHAVFNNIVCDKLKDTCRIEEVPQGLESLAVDFDLDDDSDETVDSTVNSVDFNTFMDVCGIASISGKWYCATPYNTLTAKQKERLARYIRKPSANGLLVITSDDFKEYKDLLKIKLLRFSKDVHVVEMGFPNRKVLTQIVMEKFSKKGVTVTETATDLFVMKMSAAYDEYDDMISEICEQHEEKQLGISDMKVYMKGVEHFVVEDFVKALMDPITSAKTTNKKILRMMVYLIDEYGAQNLIYKVLKVIDESIELRMLINKGYIPIGIKYFFGDVIKKLSEIDKKYEKMNEWIFRKKVELASRTSLRDWKYMQIMLRRAIIDPMYTTEEKCKRALYDVCMRTVLTSSRLDNDIGIDNILKRQIKTIDRIKYDSKSLQQIKEINSIVEEDG